MAYGTPATEEDIEPYFRHILGGREPSPEAVADLKRRYELIGGTSPLTEITNAQAEGIARHLQTLVQREVRPYVGMKHAAPFIAEAIQRMLDDGIREAVAMVMAPQYSIMSIGGYYKEVDKALADHGPRGEGLTFHRVEHWHTDPGFIAAIARRLEAVLAGLETKDPDQVMVIFTAHSLPARLAETDDPYPRHLQESAAAAAGAAGLKHWQVAYQSAGSSAIPWLGPDICDVIPQLPDLGMKAVVVCPIGFTADHLEIFYDLDVEARDEAKAAGLEFARTKSLNAAEDFVQALAQVAAAALPREGQEVPRP